MEFRLGQCAIKYFRVYFSILCVESLYKFVVFLRFISCIILTMNGEPAYESTFKFSYAHLVLVMQINCRGLNETALKICVVFVRQRNNNPRLGSVRTKPRKMVSM